mmetsp:Transcript_27117/g.61805  ORF Transcript_27117/g.61805 Transcript_27117/m.61805 type:complete len:231 (-) Transcript_27117:1097-1789(-)
MAAEDLDDAGSMPGSTRRHTALARTLIGGSFICVVGMTAPFVISQIRSPLPFMATPRAKVERALLYISSRHADAAVGRRREFVDLGSGDGTAVLSAASNGYRATGFELNSSLWMVSSLRRLLSQHRSNAQFVLDDMFVLWIWYHTVTTNRDKLYLPSPTTLKRYPTHAHTTVLCRDSTAGTRQLISLRAKKSQLQAGRWKPELPSSSGGGIDKAPPPIAARPQLQSYEST